MRLSEVHNHEAKRVAPGAYEYRGHRIEHSDEPDGKKPYWKVLDPSGVEIYSRMRSIYYASRIIDRDILNETRPADTALG
jgi:hypothetical protein